MIFSSILQPILQLLIQNTVMDLGFRTILKGDTNLFYGNAFQKKLNEIEDNWTEKGTHPQSPRSTIDYSAHIVNVILFF